MKKRNLAMAMAAVTVVGSAAPVFAAASDLISLQDGAVVGTAKKYSVANTKSSDLVKDILAAQSLTTGANVITLKDNTKVTFFDANDGDKKIYSEQTLNKTTGSEDYVKTTLKNLEAGEYALIDLEYSNNKTVQIKVVAASEKTVVVSSDAKDSAKDIAEKYVFEDSELQTALNTINKSDFSKVDSYYQVVLYPKGKRLQGFSNYRATNYNEGEAHGNTPVILTLKSTSKSNLKTAVEELQKLNASYSNTTTLAGDDRIQTAIEISKEYYNNDGVDSNKHSKDVNDNVKNVVLVGANALVDGLVAAPLAAEKDAPLLLTSKDKLDSSVKSEIKRVLDLKTSEEVRGKTVYIAGGVNSVSKEVVTELESMGLKVERFSGDDRYETSLKIADEIGLDNDKAYVVGGTGLADAMSIASVASTKLDGDGDVDRENGHATPIVVVDGKADKISDDLDSFLGSADVDIIGGFASVSEKMEEAISDATGKGVTRVKGDDRQDTNSEVIKTYYANDTKIAKEAAKDKDTTTLTNDPGIFKFYVAKDGSTKEDQLVDALAVGAVAGYKLAPVVLATDSLSSDQSVAISKVVGEDSSKDLTQVGQGIATSVINKIKDLLDM
ncbi:S-layer protein SlpA [Clostridioides sp. ES-S-0123-01]|uniref:S-layer protein SlpA n=1 Tax=Clostridioides sp. ES-S-0123-01 TaxID=2770783 RepID=UPI001D10AD8E|nr:S-layer protein SlpA [Clostridioides sp. ES-S-0123-01]